MISREPWKPGLGICVLIGLAFCLPFGVGLLRQVRVHEGLDRWVTQEKHADPLKEEFTEVFPDQSRIIVTWTDSHIDDPRVELLADKLRSRTDDSGIRRGGLKQIQQVESPRNSLKQLIASGVSQEEALQRLRGLLFGSGDLRIRLSDKGREQPETFRRMLLESGRRDLQLNLEISAPFHDAEVLETAAKDVDSEADANEQSEGLPETIFSTDYDFRVRWEGMHEHPEEVQKFLTWLNGMSLPTVGAAEVGDSPVDECFAAVGSPAAVVLQLSSSGQSDPQETLSQVRKTAESVGIPAENLRLGGIPIVESSLQQAASALLWDSRPEAEWYRKSTALLSLGVLLGLTLWFVRDAAWTFVLSMGGACAACIAILAPLWNGPRLSLLSMLSLIVVFALGLIVAQPWLRLERLYVSKGSNDPSRSARIRSWFPGFLGIVCLLGAHLTLRSYNIPPFREFSLCAALGIAVIGFLMLYGLPPVLAFMRSEVCTDSKTSRRDWVHLGKLIVRQRYPIAAALTLLLIGSALGLQKVEVENNFFTSFPADSMLRRDASFIESRLCGTIPVETAVSFSGPALENMDFRERMDLVRAVSQELKKLGEVSGASSLADLVPGEDLAEPTANEESGKRTHREKLKRASAAEAFEIGLRERGDFDEWCRIVKTGSSQAGGDREMWRIMANTRLNGTPESLMDQINGACQSITRYHPGVNHLSSTLGVLSIGDLETLKDSAVVSLGGTLAIFAAVLLILLHNPMAAALALVPIFLGCIVPVGIGSWLGYPVSPIHLLSLPFVLGVNAYLTINLLGAFFHHLQNGRDRMAAAAEAFGDFAPLMCHVYLILGAGIGVLGFSKFGMVREFGLTTLSFLATSFAVNLVGIPCFSAGWLGICFDHQKRKSNRQSGLEMVLEETLPRETAAEPNLKHSGNRPTPRTNSQRRIDGGPKKIA